MRIHPALQRAPLFQGMPQELLENLSRSAEEQRLDCGQRLYAEHDPATDFYLVISGRLRVTRYEYVAGFIGRLEPAGEMGVLSGDARDSDVHAMRDSLLLRIPGTVFVEQMNANGPALMGLTRLILDRLREYRRKRRRSSTEGHGIFAILPDAPGVPVTMLAEALIRRLGGWPCVRLLSARHVDAALGEGAAQSAFDRPDEHRRLLAWLDDLESRHDYLILVADNDHDRWAQRCLRQSDRILVLAEADQPPTGVPALQSLPENKLLAPLELVILRPEGDPSPHTLAWREALGARAHYFVHPWAEKDMESLARQMTGRGIGLVLGGGGARGFAHIGLVRALDELQIPVDVMSGTSMGAFVSALLACGFDHVEMKQIARETFVNNNFLNDYTWPQVSLIRGRRFLARLREIFGDRDIENLTRSYYCMSTNLSTGEAMVHDKGPLAVWVGTSMSVPGVAPPVAYEGELLCDGGVVDNLPTGVMQRMERGLIMASSVSAKGDVRAPEAGIGAADPGALLQWHGQTRRPSFREILMRTATLTADTVIAEDAMQRADVLLNMPVEGYGMFDWNHMEALIEAGYEHALELLEPQREALMG